MRREISKEPSESRERWIGGKAGKLVPEVVLVSDRGQITPRQLEILKAISEERSQNRAAASLGISAAVLNKQLKELEKKASQKLVETSARGSELTPQGRQLLRVLDTISRRMSRSEELTIGCTKVSQAMVERVCTKLAQRGKNARTIVTDDETNMSMAMGGVLDIVFFDDPLYAYEYPYEGRVHEVARDFLMHCERGRDYAKLNSGPQRIGFDMLKADGKEFEIKTIAHSPEELIKSKYSFFASEMLMGQRNLELPSKTRIRRMPYTIYAIETTNHADIREFFECMAPRQFYPVG